MIAIPALFHYIFIYVNDIDGPPQRNLEEVAILLYKPIEQFA